MIDCPRLVPYFKSFMFLLSISRTLDTGVSGFTFWVTIRLVCIILNITILHQCVTRYTLICPFLCYPLYILKALTLRTPITNFFKDLFYHKFTIITSICRKIVFWFLYTIQVRSVLFLYLLFYTLYSVSKTCQNPWHIFFFRPEKVMVIFVSDRCFVQN